TRQGAMPDIPETLKMTNGRIAE
ncbi:MAG: hypothetical protein ACD_75C01968G0001, partial [uncultured bacterium]